MKNKKLLLLYFILLISSFNWTSSLNADYADSEDTKIEKSIEKVPQKSKVENNKKDKNYNKKILKKEIQNRKKYHKTLVSIYNKNFDSNYLELIKENALIIERLSKNIV